MGSERQQRMKELGTRLRGLRMEAGLTGAVLAQRAGVGQPTVSKVETGRMVPSLGVLSRLSLALDLDEVTTREVRDLLAAVEAASDVADVPAAESLAGTVLDDAVRSAHLVRSFQCLVLPALLQSAGYSRHVFESAPNTTPEAVGRAVADRVERQSLLYEPGRESVFVLTEAVLRTWPGDPSLMLAQFDRLLTVDSLSTARIGVIPWRRAVPVMPRHGFTLCDQKAVVVETFRGEQLLDDPADVATYEETFTRFEEAAVFGIEAHELLIRIMAEFRELESHTTR
ncbi:helix-turn-helix domain-containing protein [Streptomyces niveiscabiei]|uniref:Helix-turn-helix domain-containing protein n=1 Tax=Streptomyces niveiscabiei TaxID=164115 RepID=A0ABW9I705_9ACTN